MLPSATIWSLGFAVEATAGAGHAIVVIMVAFAVIPQMPVRTKSISATSVARAIVNSHVAIPISHFVADLALPVLGRTPFI